MKNEKIIDDVLKFAKKLIGAPRGKSWKTYKLSSNTSPMWASNDSLPSISFLKKEGMNCAGLTNLMRRKAGLSVLVLEKDPKKVLGGTGAWFSYLKKKKRLQKFDINKSYPKGTLLLRNYYKKPNVNYIDEGHLAVIYEEYKKGVLFSSLIHSIGIFETQVVLDPTVGKHYFAKYNKKTGIGPFTHICLPEDWLLKE